MALRQHLAQKLEQRLSPQQIQLMKLLQVPTMELDQRIKQELEENPALEEGIDEPLDEFESQDDDFNESDEDYDNDFELSDYFDDDTPDYKTQVNNTSKDEEERAIPLSVEASFQEKLTEQLHLLYLDDTQFIIADTIIGNLDESGYLNRDIEAIVDDLAFSANITVTPEEVETVLKLVQELDPAGIGARDLRECLLLQIERKQEGNITLYTAKKILQDHFEEFTKKQVEVAAMLDRGEIDMETAQLEIEKYWAGALRRAVIDGDVEYGSVMAGQSVGMVHVERPVVDIIAKLVDEANTALAR